MDLALVADAHGAPPLPWLSEPLDQALKTQRGHALLVHGSSGVGALPYALTLAQARLCEGAAPDAQACGHCGSCKLVRSHVHPDLLVLLPETLRRTHEWPLADDKTEGEDSKRKPSRQIRIAEMRALIDWVNKTSARGRGKVAVVHPADSLNMQSANALLKTLEEPPAGTRLILTTADPALLLPTLRSRCQVQRLAAPATAAAITWLQSQGVAQPQVLLAACSGRPLEALALSQDGIDAAGWAALPTAVMAGRASALSGWPLPRALDALHKFCHDAMAVASGATPRYFPKLTLGAAADSLTLSRLADWSLELDRVARHDEHPWNEGLLIEALVQAGAAAVRARP